jgi:hypothetical protein
VKIPSISANGEAKIKMYYENDKASSVSDGDATFEFFDDFEGRSLDTSKWNVVNNPVITVSGGLLSLKAQVSGSHVGQIKTLSQFNIPIAIDYSWRISESARQPGFYYAYVGIGDFIKVILT